MRFAYADPPYLSCCVLYEHHHPDGRCWDDPETHRLLIDRMVAEYPDGWALSLSVPSLATILPMCPTDVRIGSWVKSFSAFKRGVRPAYAWEPIIFRGGRNPSNGHPHPPPVKGGKQTTPKDFVVVDGPAIKEPITLRKGLTGAKPEKVCRWVLDLLNVRPDDEMVDLFPGTGAMGRVFDALVSELPMSPGEAPGEVAALHHAHRQGTRCSLCDRSVTDKDRATGVPLDGPERCPWCHCDDCTDEEARALHRKRT